MTRYLIIGASGNVGSAVVASLRTEHGAAVRATTGKRNPRQTTGDVEWRHVDVTTGEGMVEAFDDVDRAFIMSPSGYVDQHKILSSLIQEAKRKGVHKVVMLSAFRANARETTPFRRAEIELEGSGLPYNIVRPNFFMQNFSTFWAEGIRKRGRVALPAGDAKVSFIDTRDISAVITHLLTTDEQNDRAFDLTGPEAMTHEEVAIAISNVTGTRVHYENIEPKVFLKDLQEAGVPEGYAAFLASLFGPLREGYYAQTTNAVTTLLNRPPNIFKKFADDYRKSWL